MGANTSLARAAEKAVRPKIEVEKKPMDGVSPHSASIDRVARQDKSYLVHLLQPM